MKFFPLGGSGRVFLIEEFEDQPPLVLKFAPRKPNPGETLNEVQKLERVEAARPLLEKHGISTPQTITDTHFVRSVVDSFFLAGGDVKDRHELLPIIQKFDPAPILGQIGRQARKGELAAPVDVGGFDDFWKRYEAFRDESGIAHHDVLSLNITLDQNGKYGLIDWGNAKFRDVDGPDVFANAVCTENLMNDMVNKPVLQAIQNAGHNAEILKPENNTPPPPRPF